MKEQFFEELFLKHKIRLRQYCLFLTNNNFADAEDLVQESFTRFFNKFFAKQILQDEDVSSVPNNEFSYLKAIAKNTRYQWYRENSKSEVTESIDESYEALQLTDNIDLDKQIDFNQFRDTCYLKLNQIERSILFAFYLEGHSQEEIARTHSISVRSVKHKLAQAKRKLQNQ